MPALSIHPRDLQRRILRLWRPDALVWAFRHSRGLDRRAPHEVEIRLNLSKATIDGIGVLEGWRIAHRKPADGMLFLRREQPLTNHALRRLFRDASVLAHRYGGRFHSWMHKPDLEDWG